MKEVEIRAERISEMTAKDLPGYVAPTDKASH